jgi:antitoxin PrlF
MPSASNIIANSTAGLETRITSQGQVSVPAAIRKKLGVEPGSTLVWMTQGDDVIVRKRGAFSSLDIHKTLFPKGAPDHATLEAINAAKLDFIRKKYAKHALD